MSKGKNVKRNSRKNILRQTEIARKRNQKRIVRVLDVPASKMSYPQEAYDGSGESIDEAV